MSGVDVLAVMDAQIEECAVFGMAEARAAVADLIEALRAYDRWDYEIRSARVNGESVYTYAELQEMREKAAELGSAALARVQGGSK